MSYDIPKCCATRTRDVRYRSVYPDYDEMYIERPLNAFDINQEIINSESYKAYNVRTTTEQLDYTCINAPTRMKTEYIPVELCNESFVPPQLNCDTHIPEFSHLSGRIDIESQIFTKDIEPENEYTIDLTDLSLSFPTENKVQYLESNEPTVNYPEEHVIDIIEYEDNLDLSRVTLTRGSNKVDIEDEDPQYWEFLDQSKNYWDFYQDESQNSNIHQYKEEDLEFETDSTHSSMPELIDISIDSDDE